eukprot:PLAT6650.1.p1 GENE.PLAT6650.1~~PLAT6650.1.p1  ORF type:complete len:248 (+),score=79.27 PLAT6650.1:107-745(+)
MQALTTMTAALADRVKDMHSQVEGLRASMSSMSSMMGSTLAGALEGVQADVRTLSPDGTSVSLQLTGYPAWITLPLMLEVKLCAADGSRIEDGAVTAADRLLITSAGGKRRQLEAASGDEVLSAACWTRRLSSLPGKASCSLRFTLLLSGCVKRGEAIEEVKEGEPAAAAAKAAEASSLPLTAAHLTVRLCTPPKAPVQLERLWQLPLKGEA